MGIRFLRLTKDACPPETIAHYRLSSTIGQWGSLVPMTVYGGNMGNSWKHWQQELMEKRGFSRGSRHMRLSVELKLRRNIQIFLEHRNVKLLRRNVDPVCKPCERIRGRIRMDLNFGICRDVGDFQETYARGIRRDVKLMHCDVCT
ncbi:uncharacterized protein G2W53_018525 [Senna tora]|uniref:Uncharacterized protein n=1 Tax=Senna tora TaxID=362788 RepID=A0A834WPX6_9FABA|nr:uncharacterized protein G2W53_018525 [Senna tora]